MQYAYSIFLRLKVVLPKVLYALAHALALQLFMSSCAIALLVYGGIPLWPLMIIGTWMWAPLITLIVASAFLLSALSVLPLSLAGPIAWYGWCVQSGLNLLEWLAGSQAPYAVPYPGLLMLVMLPLGGFMLYEHPGRIIYKIAALTIWIALWCACCKICFTHHMRWDIVTPSGKIITLHPQGNHIDLYDPQGALQERSTSAQWLTRVLVRNIVSHGHTALKGIYSPATRTKSQSRKLDNLSAGLGILPPAWHPLPNTRDHLD